jgi:hypothetical protein
MKLEIPANVHVHSILKSEQFTHDVNIYEEERKNEHSD